MRNNFFSCYKKMRAVSYRHFCYFTVYCTYMKLSPEEINQIAVLARLDLSKKEKKMYAEQLSVVFDYFEMLGEVDTEGVEETCQVTGLQDVVRDDVVSSSDPAVRQMIVGAFPEKVGDLLKVKAVFE